jgi:hypothetical protein
MSPALHPVRDGVIAVTLGAVLALLVIFGVRALQVSGAPGGQSGPGVPEITPGQGTDACTIQGGRGGAPEPDPTAGPEFPPQEFPLDTGQPIEVSGTGNAEIVYERLGEFATVVGFECEECTGDLTLFNTGAAAPILTGETIGEQVEIEWLIDTVHEQTGPRNSLLIRASGNWTLTLRSWFDLPVSSGTISSTGSKVVRVDASQVRLTLAPLNSRDVLNVYSYRLADREFSASTCIGRRESQVLDLNGGQVLLLWARGDWTLETI